MGHLQDHLDPFNLQRLRHVDAVDGACGQIVRNHQRRAVADQHLLPIGGGVRGIRPGLCQANSHPCVDQPVTQVLVDGVIVQAAAVPVRCAVEGPDMVARAAFSRAVGQDLLDIAITQRRVGLQHQRDHARDDGRCKRGAGQTGVVAGVESGSADTVGGDDVGQWVGATATAAGCADQYRSTGGAVARDIAVEIGGCDGDDVLAVLKVVQIGVVAIEVPIGCGLNHHGAEPAATVGRELGQRDAGR